MPIEEVLRSGQKELHGLEQLAVGDFATKVAPQQLDGVEPWTVGRQIEQDQTASSRSDHGLDLVVLMRSGVVPGDIDDACRVLVEQGLQQLGDLRSAFTAAEQDSGCSGMIVDGANAVVLLELTRGGDHDLLTFGTPHGLQSREPGEIELIGIVEDIPRTQVVSGVFNRLFFT
jgi:hypothetical protein